MKQLDKYCPLTNKKCRPDCNFYKKVYWKKSSTDKALAIISHVDVGNCALNNIVEYYGN